MQLAIERRSLLSALGHLSSVVKKRNTIPILSNVLLEAKGGVVTLAATDLDISLEERVDAAVGTSGKTTVPAHQFREIVKKLPEGAQVQISTVKDGGGRILVQAGRSKFELATLPHEDYPTMAMGTMPCEFSIDAGSLRKLIGAVKWSMSQEETRYYLNGFFLHVHEGKMLRAVSTDGHRLTRYETDLPAGAETLPGIIIPRKTAGELSRLLDGVEGDVTVSASDSKIELQFSGMVFRSKLIDGTFPPYDRVIPSDNRNIMTADAKDLANVVDRMATIGRAGHAIKMDLRKDGLTVSALNPEAGTATEDMDAEFVGTPMEIGFNSRYMGALLSQLPTSSARFLFGDAGSPLLVEAIGDSSVIFVLMPVRC